jgi:hypothetical protein
MNKNLVGQPILIFLIMERERAEVGKKGGMLNSTPPPFFISCQK